MVTSGQSARAAQDRGRILGLEAVDGPADQDAEAVPHVGEGRWVAAELTTPARCTSSASNGA